MLAGALALVLGSVRIHGWLSLQRAERHLLASLGAEAFSGPLPVGRDGTTVPHVLAALAALDAREEQLAPLSELAMLPAVPMSQAQRESAEELVAVHAAVLAELERIPEREVARLGLWQDIEPEAEGKLQAGLLMLAQLAAIEGRLACETRDAGRLERSLAVLGGLATGLELEDRSQPLLVGLMVEHLQHLLLARAIAAGATDAQPAGRLEAALGAADLRLAYRRTLRGRVAELEALRSPLAWSPAGFKAWLSDAVYFDVRLARALDELGLQASEIDRPLLAPLSAAASLPGLGSIAAAGALGLPWRIQLVEAARGLARASLALRRLALRDGRYPRELAEAREALGALQGVGVGVVLEHGGDGSARLRVPGGDEALRSIVSDAGHPALLTWELPPPSRPSLQ